MVERTKRMVVMTSGLGKARTEQTPERIILKVKDEAGGTEDECALLTNNRGQGGDDLLAYELNYGGHVMASDRLLQCPRTYHL